MSKRPKAQRLIGLTGNIACGKSTAAKFLGALDIPVIDADRVAREVTEPGEPTLLKVISTFGKTVLDSHGALDRLRMRTLVFSDPAKRKELEALLHPAIAQRSEEHIQAAFAKGYDLVVYEAPLLIEAGRQKDMGGVLLITCSTDTQRDRLLARDAGTDPAIAEQMIASQLNQTEKIRHATWIIENDGTLDELQAKIAEWAKNMKSPR